jgi:tagatose-1,6-bisphosphate aldolase
MVATKIIAKNFLCRGAISLLPGGSGVIAGAAFWSLCVKRGNNISNDGGLHHA